MLWAMVEGKYAGILAVVDGMVKWKRGKFAVIEKRELMRKMMC